MSRYDEDDMPYIVVEKQGGGAFAAFVWGAILGAGAALLLAPKSGAETREGLVDGVRKLRDTAEDAVQRAQDAVTGTIDDVRTQVTTRIDAARSAMDAGRQAARDSRADMERKIRETRAGFEGARRAYKDGATLEDEIDLEDDDGEL